MSMNEQLLIQANENLRATDSKRDRIFYLFVVIFGLYLTFYKDMMMEPLLLMLSNIFLIIFGFTIIFVIINYQIWHFVYISTAIVLQKIINRNISNPISKEIITELFCEEDTKSAFFSRYGASFFIYNSILIINFMLFILLIFQLIANIGTIRWILTLSFFFIIYIYVLNLAYKKKIENAKDNFIKISWILKS